MTLNNNLAATVKGSEGFTDVETLDEYDADSLPGAFGLKVSMNPVDWAKDPGKHGEKNFRRMAESSSELGRC
jgi:hypothetical protein